MLKELKIENYKSLRSIVLTPSNFNVFIGANGSGKSNLGDCFDFLRLVYNSGLEAAVGTKGGFENIAFRKIKRTKLPISFEVNVELPFRRIQRKRGMLQINHQFKFAAKSGTIRSSFRIIEESIRIKAFDGPELQEEVHVWRQGDRLKFEKIFELPQANSSLSNDFRELEYYAKHETELESTSLFAIEIGRFTPSFRLINRFLSGIRVYQIAPSVSRTAGTPTSHPELGKYGENLPTVVDQLKHSRKPVWESIMAAMRSIIPDLLEISVVYTDTRRLGLTFKEQGVGRPWSVDEISDGTIQTLALLTAVNDPQASLLFVEEPENSVHPWAIRNFAMICRSTSKSTQTFVTTHSPVLIDNCNPTELLIVWRETGETKIKKLLELAPKFLSEWKKGKISSFIFLDSGILTEAVPPSSQLVLDLTRKEVNAN